MTLKEDGLKNVDILDRICEAYGFAQKMELAQHFDIAASSLSSRYRRDTISYDFVVHCSLETGADLHWILTGTGPKFSGGKRPEEQPKIPRFVLTEGKLVETGSLAIEPKLFDTPFKSPMCVVSEKKTYFIEKDASLSDGVWLVDVEGSVSIREITVLPAKKLHVAGGKVPFECATDEITMLGLVVGTYSEVN